MKEKRKFKKRYVIIPLIVLAILIPVAISFFWPSPKGSDVVTSWYDIEDLDIIFDLTYLDNGEYIHDQHILDQQIDMINKAQDYIIIDLFLFNDDYDREKHTYPKSTQKFTDALIKKKNQNSNIDIVFITDPVNNFYGAYEQEVFTQMKNAGIDVIVTDLTKLRDPNFIYSGLWRVYIDWLGRSGLTWIPNLEDKTAPNVNIRTALEGVNAKGNHRKVIITDKEAMITSANPHDPSSYHANVAFRFKSNVITDLIKTEQMVGEISKYKGDKINQEYIQTNNIDNSMGKIRVLTEKQIYYALKENIDNAKQGDTIYVCTFYLCDFDILNSIIDASKKGVQVYMILDPNETALGTKLYGIPNRVAMNKMYKKANGKINIRWYNSNEVQYHTKMMIFKNQDYMNIIGGSANFTRRNIKGFNLETDVEIKVGINTDIAFEMQAYFDKLWNNEGAGYTVDFDTYKDENIFKYWLYLFEESTGFGTF